MPDSYKYIDPDYKYTDKNGVLRNLLGVTNQETLVFVESGLVAKRLKELYDRPIKITGVESLFTIHKHLFQDVYVWAGEKRTVEISKSGNQFFPTSNFETAFGYIDGLIKEFRKTDTSDKEVVAKRLAELLDNVNYLHPFREGNGRTQREFIRLLALEKGFKLNLNPPDDITIFKRYMEGTINSDTGVLTELILEIIEPV